MAMADRRAEASWAGNLIEGSGTLDLVSSGVASSLPITWASRTENADGRTSPEELLAAAHTVTGSVPGLDQAGFQAAAEAGEQGCPISNAIRNNVAITVKATLD